MGKKIKITLLLEIDQEILKNKTKQNKTKQIKTKQNKTKQNKTKQNKSKQNKTKQKAAAKSMHQIARIEFRNANPRLHSTRFGLHAKNSEK